MIIDFHTHIFPPAVRDQREEYLRRDPNFEEMYASPKARIAAADDLLRSMDESGVDVSVVLGFAWRDHELCVRHNDYLLESAARSGGRIVPFCTLNPLTGEAAVKEVERCVAAGARGLGELRPDSQGWDLTADAGDLLAELAEQHGLILLFHVTEPVGHEYPGKSGLDISSFFRFCQRHREVTKVGAHLGGGLPFYMSNTYVHEAFANLYVDTAAQPLLYSNSVYEEQLAEVIDRDALIFGSDYPLLSPKVLIDDIRVIVAPRVSARILGGNAQQLLGLVAGRRADR